MTREEMIVRIVTIISLGVVLLASVVGLTVVAVTTDRDVVDAGLLTFGGITILAALGGVTWHGFRRRHWRVNLEREEPGDEQAPSG